MKNNTYEGKNERDVTVNGKPLNPRNNIVNHSPDGFAWGYAGSGPSQLALAIMCEEYGDDIEKHPISYHELKLAVIATIKKDHFTFTSDTVIGVVKYIEGKQHA